MLAGGEPNHFGAPPASHLRASFTCRSTIRRLSPWPPRRSTSPPARRPAAPGNTAPARPPRPSGVPGANPRAAVPVFRGLAHPTHLGHAQSVRIQPAGDGHQPRHRAGHHAVGDAERPQRQQFAVRHRRQHRRRRLGAARHQIRQQLQPRANFGIGARPAQPVVVDLGRRPPARAAGPAPAAAPAATPRPTSPRRLRAPAPPATRRRTPDRSTRPVVHPHRTAVEHRRSPRRPQRRLGGGHRPAPQVGPVPVRPAQRVAGPVAGLGDAGQLQQRGQWVSAHGLTTYRGVYRGAYRGGAAAPGIASSNWRVYSWRGRLNTSSVGACSTTRPARMTRTSSAICRTTARSWVMNR